MLKKIIVFAVIILFFSSCKALKPEKVDTREVSTNAQERARKNIETGRGSSLGGILNRGTNYEFSTANPMWRASLETLDFLPLTTVDYSGGIIITDWYFDSSASSDESIKITVRFLSNNIRSESIKIIVHQRVCKNSGNCKIQLLDKSNIQEELHRTILKKASLIDKNKKNKKK